MIIISIVLINTRSALRCRALSLRGVDIITVLEVLKWQDVAGGGGGVLVLPADVFTSCPTVETAVG